MNAKTDGTHYIADHVSGNIIEVWYSSEPELIGWVGRLTDGGNIVPLNPNTFTALEERK